MLANRLAEILPELSEQKAIQFSPITSVSEHKLNANNWRKRHFRSLQQLQ